MPAHQLRVRVSRVALPFYAVFSQEWTPSQSTMRAHIIIIESILPVAPCSEHHPCLQVSIDDAVCPARRDNNLVSRAGLNCYAVARIVKHLLLRIDDGVSLPYLDKFWSGPSAVGSYGMNMSLAANRLVAQPPAFISNNSEQQHPLP